MALPLPTAITLVSGKSFAFNRAIIAKGPQGLMANVVFDALDADGRVVGNKTLNYSGVAYNAFWTAFNTGKYLYDELVLKEALVVTVPDSVEADFTNPVPSAPTGPTG